MKKHYLAIAGIITTLGLASATPLTPEAALKRAEYSSASSPALRSVLRTTPKAVLKYTAYQKSSPAVYLFGFESSPGYLVLSADDATVPVLGYSDDGIAPSNESEMAPQLKYWLGELGRQVEWNASHPLRLLKTLSPQSSWNNISPMVDTRWNQDAPYYNDCPKIGTRHCFTGCVATAMAQVIRYYQYPNQGEGTHSYTWTYTDNGISKKDTLSFDYGSTTFDWSKLAYRYDSSSSEEDKAAVAQLMYACGVGVDMAYGLDGSGAVSFKMIRAFIENFKYGKGVRYQVRDFYGIDEWNEIVYNNLVNYGPVLYGGQSNDGGHQFICDGYSDGYFHFNWGWGGMSDGYFLLTALNPESQGIGGSTSGYNFDQDILTGLSTSQDQTEAVQLYWTEDFTITQPSVSLGSDITYAGQIANYSYSKTSGVTIGIEIVPTDGGDPIWVASRSLDGLGPMYGANLSSVKATIPADLAEGTYTVYPAYKTSDGAISRIYANVNSQGQYTLTVEGNTATFSAEPPASVQADNFALDGDVYLNTDFKVTATLTNTSTNHEFLGNLIVGLVQNGSVVATGSKMAVDLIPGESTAWEYVAEMVASDSSNPPSPGTYDLYLLKVDDDGSAGIVAGPITVTLHDESPATLHVSDLKIEDGQSLDNIHATATLECSAGYFAGNISLIIFPGDGGSELASYNSNYVAVGAATTATRASDTGSTQLVYDFSFPSGEPETNYLGLIYYKGSFISNQVRFKTGAVTGVSEMESEGTQAEYYDLQGRRVENPGNGIFVERRGGKVQKIVKY